MKGLPGKILLHIARICLLVGLAALLNGPACADGVPRGLLVKLTHNASAADFAAAHHVFEIRSIPGHNIHAVQADDGRSQDALYAELCTDPRVRAIEGDQPLSLEATQYYFARDGEFGVPVNTNVYNQIDYGPLSQWLNGTGVIVAVLDTGADFTHPDLLGHLMAGYNFVSNTSDPSDVPDDPTNPGGSPAAGHGTFNAGIVATMASGAQIMPLKVLNGQGIGYLSDVLAAIQWAINNNANVINMSFSADQPSMLLQEAIDEAHQAGLIIVASAGNNSNSAPCYPAACRYVLGIASVDADNTLSSFSNYGYSVSFVAPGNGILGDYWDGTYAIGGGTSFAAPFVTGLAALLFSANGDDGSFPGGNTPCDPSNILQAMQISAFSVDSLNPNYAGLLGNGLIDCDNAVFTLLSGNFGG